MKAIKLKLSKVYKKIFTTSIFSVFILITVLSIKSNAQTINIKGAVSSSNIPVRYASLVFINNADTSKKYSVLTDSLGNYQVNVEVTSINTTKNNLPTKFKLEQNYPNPFSTSTDIPYKLKNPSDVHVTIYDILGRVVRKFSVGNQAGGSHDIIWDGRNNFGTKAATGIYFYRLQAGGQSQVKKMVFNYGHGNFSPVLTNNYSYQIPGTLRNSKIEIEGGSYTVKIENSDNILPAIIPQQFSNLMIQSDTTLNFTVSSQTIASIYLNNTQQIIRGFGGANVAIFGRPYMTTAQVQTAFGNGKGQIGMTIMRLSIPPDSTQFSAYAPSALAAQNLGATIIATPWSPPAWMKTNNSLSGGSLKPNAYAAYAAHLKAFADTLAAHGVTVNAVSVQNEPDVTVSYQSCFWNATEFLNFMKNNSPAVGVPVFMPESYHFDHQLSDSTLNDPEAAANVAFIGGHIYGGGIAPYPLAVSKGKETWMTEYLINSGSSSNITSIDTGWAGAIQTAKSINDCMAANMSAYVWWYIVRYYGPIGDGLFGIPNGTVTKKGYVMSQFSKFVRPGYYKVENSAPQGGVYMTAYKDSSSSKVVIVALNTGSSKLYQTITIDNGKVTSFVPYTTSDTQNVEQGNNINVSGGKFTAVLEPSSITTFVSN